MSAEFIEAFNAVKIGLHATACSKGWWDNRDGMEEACNAYAVDGIHQELGEFSKIANQLGCLMLVVSEISEAVEAIRQGNPPDDKIPNFSGAEAECADAIIRLMDLAERCNWRLAEAIIEKAKMNKGRPHLHGGKKA